MQPYYKVGDSVDLSGTNSVTFEGCAWNKNMSFQYVFSTVVGTATIVLQASNDGTNFDSISGYSDNAVTESGSGSFQLTGSSAVSYRVAASVAATSGSMVVTSVGNG